MDSVNCYHCEYFAVSWDRKFPKTCKFFGFKTNKMPSFSVRQSTGSECIAFKEKTVTRRQRRLRK
jgi:hypothetical protein